MLVGLLAALPGIMPVVESAREIPIADEVDVLVVGGTAAGVSAMASALRSIAASGNWRWPARSWHAETRKGLEERRLRLMPATLAACMPNTQTPS